MADYNLDDYQVLWAVPIALSVELGRRIISLQELLRLEVDDVLTLTRPTGEDVDLVAGDVLLGKAELLASGDKLAVRVADVASHARALPGELTNFDNSRLVVDLKEQ